MIAWLDAARPKGHICFPIFILLDISSGEKFQKLRWAKLTVSILHLWLALVGMAIGKVLSTLALPPIISNHPCPCLGNLMGYECLSPSPQEIGILEVFWCPLASNSVKEGPFMEFRWTIHFFSYLYAIFYEATVSHL